MEDQTPASPVPDETQASDQQALNQPGPQAVEALVRAIAQEFVLAFDEIHNAILADDQVESSPKVQAAGS